MAGVHFILGDDTERIDERTVELLGGPATERIDLADAGVGALLRALGSASLFAAERRVDVRGMESLAPEQLSEILTAPVAAEVTVVLRATKLSSKQEEALKGASVERHLVPTGQALAQRINYEATKRGIELSEAQQEELCRKAGLERSLDLLDQLQLAGVGKPSDSALRMFMGPAVVQVAIWQLGDAVETADSSKALELLQQLWSARSDAFGVLGYLRARMESLGQVVESGTQSSADVARQLGVTSQRAGALVRAARGRDAGQIAKVWLALSEAEARAKTGSSPEAAVEIALVKICSYLSAP